MNLWYLPIGIAMGVFVAAPIGPVNLICINRGLAFGALSAFTAGIGAALGDTLFAALAAFGVSSFTEMIATSRDPIRLIGGAVMLGFSYAVWRSKPPVSEDGPVLPAWRQSIAAFVITVTNPATLMGFAAIFAGAGFKALGAGSADRVLNSAILVLGVLLGSLFWWAFLAMIAGRMQSRVSLQMLTRINQASAVALALFGVGAIAAGVLP